MLNIDIFNTNSNLFKDFETLKKIDVKQGDKLAVKGDNLVINEGGFLQAPSRTFKNLIYGGYNRDAVVEHLKEMINKTEVCLKILHDEPNYLNYGKEVKQFTKTLKKVVRVISDIEFSYHGTAFPASNDQTSSNLTNLYEKLNGIRTNLQVELKSKNWKNFLPTQKNSIDFNAPLNLGKIKDTLPSKQSVNDTLKLAKAAESQRVPLWQKVGVFALKIIATCALSAPVVIATLLKWIVWNPIEYLFKGKIITQHPIEWARNSLEKWAKPYLSDDVDIALNLYANQLLKTPVITEEHIEAFCKLAPNVIKLDLYLTSTKIKEKHCKNHYYISSEGLHQVIQAVGLNTKCTTIEIPMGEKDNKDLKSLLMNYGFKYEYGGVYTR